MRIVIETDEGVTPKPSVHAEPGPQAETTPAPPPEIAATAAALGAAPAGPAPSEAAGSEPTTFVTQPVTPETAPDGGTSTSAGAAPEFALGTLVEVEEEREEGDAEG